MFQYREAILVGPVVEYFAQEEDRDFLLLNRLWVKEAMGFGFRVRLQPWYGKGEKSANLGASRGRTQARRACSSSKTVIHPLSGTHHRSQ